jgi:hypothetical protein
MRISEDMLEKLVTRVNHVMGTPTTPFAKGKGWNVGCYVIDHAYGGVALHQILSDQGSIRDVLRTGHIKKKELYHQICAYLNGVYDGTEKTQRQ